MKQLLKTRQFRSSLMAWLLSLLAAAATAGPIRDRILARTQSLQPAGVQVIRDVAYGPDARQRFDVYAPEHAKDAPVIFMVHGGAWAQGDKQAQGVLDNKLARWSPQGFVLISVNYRMLPQTKPLEQARDLALALATAQNQAASWGADRHQFILMGHSAGAHLVALLTTSPAISQDLHLSPWLGSVLLDSAAMDVVQLMQTRHLALYDRAFGTDTAYWRQTSPFHRLTQAAQPLLAVCSTRRETSCAQADQLVEKAVALGTRASTLKLDLNHGDINQRLGLDLATTPTSLHMALEACCTELDKDL